MSIRVFFPVQEPDKLEFSVIAARFDGKWIYVRHRERDTFEIPGGHIENSESAEEAAARELHEESGATGFTLTRVCVYGVERGGSAAYGALFFAEVTALGDIPDYEMAERGLFDTPPEKQTYPEIQPMLFERVTAFLRTV